MITQNNQEIEIWKDIKNYENYYQVSNLGRIKSLSRIVDKGYNIKQPVRERLLKARPNQKGYFQVFLCKKGLRKIFTVHRLVACAFIVNPLNLPQINHISNCKADNRVENLEWINQSDNMQHAFKNGFKNCNNIMGEKNHNAKLNQDYVKKIRLQYASSEITQAKLAILYGVSEGLINHIIHYKTWKHVI